MIRSSSKIGRLGDAASPAAVQSTWTWRGVGGDRPLLELDALGTDVRHASQAHDVLDAAQRRALGLAQDRSPEEAGFDVWIEPNEDPVVLEAMEEIA